MNAPPNNARPLSWPEQRRNLVIFAACTGMQYLAAPVLYVGITQAALCDHLKADARTSNLPATLYFAMTAIPALFAWLSPRAAALRRNLMLCYTVSGLMLATLAVAIALPLPTAVKLGAVILQGGVSGAVMPAAIAFLWEAIGRGSDESRRGLALGLAFGAGPVLAVVGSFIQTALLGGDLFGLKFAGIAAPWSFVVLFAIAAPVMAAAAGLSQLLIIPPAGHDQPRQPLGDIALVLIGVGLMFVSVALLQLYSATSNDRLQIAGWIAGLLAAAALVFHFRSILTQRVLLLATVVTILVYAGNSIPSNMNLFSKEVLGDDPAKFAGVQNMLRFGFKVIAGALLGFLLTRTNPRAGLLATATIFLAAQLWAIFVSGSWYLVAFGLYGAGELVGVYAPNYIVSASRPQDLRRNTAFLTMLMAPAAPAGYLYGAIADYVRKGNATAFNQTSAALGFRLSFLVCAALIACGILVAVLWLPKRPQVNMTSDES